MNENTKSAELVIEVEVREDFICGQPDISKVFDAHYRAEQDLLNSLTEERRKEIMKELGYE